MKDPTGLTAAQARKIVRPFKPQPPKRPDDRGGPFGVTPPVKPPVKPTVEKPPVVKAPPKPPAAPPAPPQAPQQQSFDDFLKGLFGGQQAPQEQQSFNDFISQFLQPQQQPDYKSILEQLFAPVNQQYQQQLGGLNQFNSSQNEAVKSFTSQLANQLQGMGDSVYTPELAAALGLEAQREASWSQYGNQQKLYDSTIGGFQQDLPDMFSKIIDQYGQQAPSTSDLIQLRKLYDDENGGAGGLDPSTVLSAWNSYSGGINDQNKLALDTAKYEGTQKTAAAKAAADQMTKNLGLVALYQARGLPIPPALAKAVGLAPGIKLPPTTDQKNAQEKTRIALENAKTARQRAADSWNAKVATLKESARFHNMTIAQRDDTLRALNIKRTADIKAANRRVQIAQQNANTAQKRAAATKTTASNVSKTNLTTLGKTADSYKEGKPISVTVKNPHYGKEFDDGKIDKRATVTETQQTKALKYGEAFNRLVSAGASRAQALQIVDSRWKRGEQGRPWVDKTERQILSRAGLRAGVSTGRDGQGYLTEKQANALKAKAQLPRGSWAQTPDGKRIYLLTASYG